jgi:hyperosmotically inducible protein
MRRISTIMIVASAALALAFVARAQDAADATAKASVSAPASSDQTFTPIAQGNSKVDLKTTARIRKEIMASNDFSVNARNVTIVTNATKVTLRGPVDTAKEKRLIGEIAERNAPPGNVDNQLEVKGMTD